METPLFFKMLAGTIRTVGQDDDGAEVVRMVHVTQGDQLPDGVPDDELERLTRIGAVAGKAAISVVRSEPAAGGNTAATTKPNADNGSFADHVARTGVKKLVDEVAGDVEKARMVLEAERVRGGEPRSSLVKALEKVIGGAS